MTTATEIKPARRESLTLADLKVGDLVRLHGTPGVLRVIELASPDEPSFIAKAYPVRVARIDDVALRSRTLPSSIVELNGEPVPMGSTPCVPPANDYPHPVTFVRLPESEAAFPSAEGLRANARYRVLD